MLQQIFNEGYPTPLVNLPMSTELQVFAKLEFEGTPTGSIKDRLAAHLIGQAEASDKLKPGGKIIEASSGNFGIALARIGSKRGYEVTICAPAKTSREKQQAIRDYGAELIVCQGTSLDDPDEYHNRARSLHEATPGSYMPDQYHTADNPEAYYLSLGPEIWQQTKGKVTHLFAAASTGGTVSGVGRYLKKCNPAVQVIAVDAATSVRATNGHPVPHALEGIGITFSDAPCLDRKVIDYFQTVTETEAREALIDMNEQYNLILGGSAGAVSHAIRRALPSLPMGSVVVGIFADSGNSYYSKFQYERTRTAA